MSKTRVVVATALVAAFAACSADTPKFALTTAEKRGVLKSNGLRFVIMPDPSTQLVEVDVHYDVGSREDPIGKAGLAHLVEHLMFQVRPDGPDTPPIFQTLLDLSTFVNAFTEWDATHYWTTVRAENFDAMMKIEAMRMFFAADVPDTFGCSKLPMGEFEREREVVRNEIRAGSKAEDYVQQLIEAQMYPNGHAYQREIGGNDQQIASNALGDACEFMKKYYTPSRATVIIAGGVDPDQAVASLEKWFSRIPKREAAPRVKVEPFTAEHKTHEIEADVERPSVYIGWSLPARNTPEGEAAYFGMFSTLGQLAAHAEDYSFAYRVDGGVIGGRLAPLALIHIELKSLAKLDEALEFAKKSAKQAYRGWDEGTYDEIEEAKNREKARFIVNLEALPSRTVQMGYMVQFEPGIDFNSSQLYTFHALDKISKFDRGTIASAVKKSIDWDKAAIVVVKPNKQGLKGDTRAKLKFEPKPDVGIEKAAVDPREAKRPIKVATELKGLAAAQHVTLDNGMGLVMLPIKAMPVATAMLIFKNAGDASTPDNPALASVTADFLRLPMGAEAFARSGINIGCGASVDATTCYAHGVNLYLEVMLRGFERLVVAGEFGCGTLTRTQACREDPIERWQKHVREDWKLQSTQAENEYVRQVYTALYGPDHPYTKTAILTPDAASKVHLDALNTFRKKHYTAGNATLVLVGNFDPKYAESLVRDRFGSWSKGDVDKPVPSAVYKRTGPAFIGVRAPKEDQQATVTIAYPAPAGVDGQEGARRVLAAMMNIRAENVRFKLGSTYGLYFARQPHKGPSGYILRGGAVMGGTIDAERAGESIKALRESIASLRAGDAEWDEDFVRARRQLLGNLLGESTVTQELAQRLSFIASYGLNVNYYNTLLQQIAMVSPAQIRSLLETELDPANEVVVVLADKAHLDKLFSEAGITDVKIVEPDYK
jgi:zinc protease